MNVLYSVVIHCFYLLMLLASLFNKKALLWVKGRKHWVARLKEWKTPGGLKFWFHAASLGEFEQGLPVMEEMKKRFPDCTIILTFYSPSGYEHRKNDKRADYITYLPLDTRYNANKFISLINPDAVFFIKYEFWFHYLDQLCIRNIPVYLISAKFRSSQVFFQWYGKWYLNQLKRFRHLFVQDKISLELLNSSGINNSSISGDTRFDRVMKIASATRSIPIAEKFVNNGFCMVAGSTWHPDEDLLCRYINQSGEHMKFIIAPHEINSSNIMRLAGMMRHKTEIFSGVTPETVNQARVLIIDNIGMLSSLYGYGRIAYVGGGFGKGIHNILEAAVYGIPVIFGPNYQKFGEAAGMIKAGCGFSVNSYDDLKDLLDNKFAPDSVIMNKASENAARYIKDNTGATETIVNKVVKNLKPIKLSHDLII